jgi:Right handed beta helix region
MNRYTLAALVSAAACSALTVQAAPQKPDFYVSPIGNDAWSGKLDKPNSGRTDGPFASIDRARAAVRDAKKMHTGPVLVSIHGGTYFLNTPLKFTPEDSGSSPAQPIIYAAYPGEQPVVSGGYRLPEPRMNINRYWEVKLNDVASGKWVFSQLFVDGFRRSRPRLPKYDYFRVGAAAAPSPAAAGKGFDRLGYKPGDISPGWYDLNSVEVLGFQIWTMARMRIASVDDKAHVVTFTGHTNGTEAYSGFPRGNRYIVENVREALQDPGEWYLDRKTGSLSYIPQPEEDIQKAVIIAPRLAQIVQVQGDLKQHKWVENIAFRGITFAHTNWNSPPEGNAFAQAEANLDAAISCEAVRHCEFTSCTIKHTGNWGLELGSGCRDNLVESCELSDLGAGGIKIGAMNIPADPEQIAANNTVRNTNIAHAGRIHPAGTGVWIGQSFGNEISHNEIHDLYYTGISAGWTWGYGNSQAHDNKITYNKIYDIGQGVLSDMGGIYTLGIATGTVLDHNVIHDVESYDYGGWGIYPDEGSSNLQITNNIVYRTKTGGFHQHYGQNNQVTNNIFAYSKEGQIIRTRAEDHLSFNFNHNIVLFKEGTLLGSNWSGDQFRLDYNLYFDQSGNPVTFAGQTLDDWQRHAQDVHSVIADPLFTDPADGIFHLKDGSPALKLGIKPIDVNTVGPHPVSGIPFKQTNLPRAFPPPPPAAAPEPIVQTFEDVPVGSVVPEAVTSEEQGGGTVRVTDETAHTGTRCLKFTDKAGQKNTYNPHIFFQPKYETGTVTGTFSIKLEPGAIFSHEWRDNAAPYHTGPSIRIDEAGRLYASGRMIDIIPLGKWVTIEIQCSIGEAAKGTWSMTITQENLHFKHYQDLNCSPLFKKLTWYGFVSDTDGPSVFYIDDINLHQ